MTAALRLDCIDREADTARQQVLRLLAARQSNSEALFTELGLILDEMAAEPDELLLRIGHLIRAFTFAAGALAHHLAQVYGADYSDALAAVDQAFTHEKLHRDERGAAQ